MTFKSLQVSTMLKILFFNKNKFLRFLSTNLSHLISFAKPLPALKLNDKFSLCQQLFVKKNLNENKTVQYLCNYKTLELFILECPQKVLQIPQKLSDLQKLIHFSRVVDVLATLKFQTVLPLALFWLNIDCKSHSYYHQIKNNHPLTHFSPMPQFYTTWIPHISIRFQGGIEMWHWTKMG